MSGGSHLQAHTASAHCADGAFTNEFSTGELKRCNDLGQAVHNTAHVAGACLHALNGRHGKPCQFGQRLLVYTEQSTCGAHLWASDHEVSSEQSDADLNHYL